jgi:hypothetical protein
MKIMKQSMERINPILMGYFQEIDDSKRLAVDLKESSCERVISFMTHEF